MECNKIQEKLSAYIEDIILSDEKTLIEEHLKSCQRCRESLADLRKTIEHIKNIEEVEPPSWLTQKTMTRVKAEAETKKGIFQRLFYPLYIKIPVGAIATIAIAVTTIYIFKAIQLELKLAKAPSEIIERKESPVIARGEAPSSEGISARGEKQSQKPGAVSSELTKDKIPSPSAPVIPPRPPLEKGGFEAEQPLPAKEPETMEKFAESKAPEPLTKRDVAMPSAGAVAKEELKREAAPTGLKAKVLAEKKKEDTSWIKYKNNKLQIEFSYPSDYEISSEKYGSSECEFFLIFKRKQLAGSSTKHDDYAIYSILRVTLVKSSFEKAAEDNYFQKKGNEWVVLGRHGMFNKALPISGKNWKGFKGETFVGAHDERGYSGLQEVLKIFAMFENNSDCSVVFYSEGMPEEIFYKILSSFKFSK